VILWLDDRIARGLPSDVLVAEVRRRGGLVIQLPPPPVVWAATPVVVPMSCCPGVDFGLGIPHRPECARA
jgi:hypothetical protein